jgi:hypothetical protein
MEGCLQIASHAKAEGKCAWQGFSRMVGMELPHGLGAEVYMIQANTVSGAHDGQNGITTQNTRSQPQQDVRAAYEGQFYEDKRYGIGLYRTPKGYFYLGEWVLGLRHGVGIEGSTVNGALVIPHTPARKCML